MSTDAMIAKDLRAGYRSGDWLPLVMFFNWAVCQRRSPRTTNVDRLRRRLPLSQWDMDSLLRAFEINGLIELPVNYRNRRSRFRWVFTLRSIVDVANGKTRTLERIGEKMSPPAVRVCRRKLPALVQAISIQ